MSLLNPKLALKMAERCLAIVEEDLKEYNSPSPAGVATAELRGMLPLMRDIAESIQPRLVSKLEEPEFPLTDLDGEYCWQWIEVLTAAQTLVGALKYLGVREQILGPAGPTLAANRLHPWVWDVAADLWDGGHHAQAVEDAFQSVERRTQVKVNNLNLNGKGLYGEAFSTKAPTAEMSRLRFPDIDEAKQQKTWVSAHEGAMHLGMACAQGIRNLRAHPSSDITEQEALEQLAALSVLARWVDACEVVKADPSAPDSP